MERKQCRELALELVAARQVRTTVQAPSGRGEVLSLADAYVVAALVDVEWSKADHRPNGVKIGLTNDAKWPALGINAPVWGTTYADTTVERIVGPVNIDPLLAPRIEAEVIVGIAHALEPGASATEVAAAIAWAALGFELVDCHVEQWRVTAADLVADFGVHAALVIGPRRRLTPTESMALDQLSIELSNGLAPAKPGRGDAVLGGPVRAIAALLAAPDAPTLRAGSVVSTGALTGGAHPIAAGERWHLTPTSGPLPGATLSLSDSGGQR